MNCDAQERFNVFLTEKVEKNVKPFLAKTRYCIAEIVSKLQNMEETVPPVGPDVGSPVFATPSSMVELFTSNMAAKQPSSLQVQADGSGAALSVFAPGTTESFDKRYSGENNTSRITGVLERLHWQELKRLRPASSLHCVAPGMHKTSKQEIGTRTPKTGARRGADSGDWAIVFGVCFTRSGPWRLERQGRGRGSWSARRPKTWGRTPRFGGRGSAKFLHAPAQCFDTCEFARQKSGAQTKAEF